MSIFVYDPSYIYQNFGDHHKEIGGRFDLMGKKQFELMIKNGLRKDDVLVDIGCGSLRGGVHFIRYLNRGCYLGMEMQEWLLQAGVQLELGLGVYEVKKPELVVSAEFDFDLFTKKPTIGLAQSLFTHLTGDEVVLCLQKLAKVVDPGFVLWSTFHSPDGKRLIGKAKTKPTVSGPHVNFMHSYPEVKVYGERAGFRMEYVGGWDHPNKQVLVKYVKL